MNSKTWWVEIKKVWFPFVGLTRWKNNSFEPEKHVIVNIYPADRMVLTRAAKLALFYPENGHNSARNKGCHCRFFLSSQVWKINSNSRRNSLGKGLSVMCWWNLTQGFLFEQKKLCTEFQKGGPFPIEAYVTRQCSVCHLRMESDSKLSWKRIILCTEFPGGGPYARVGIITRNLW